VGALSNAFVWRLSVAYIGPKSRTERPRKTKIGTEVAHTTRDSDTAFKVKGQGHQAALLTTTLTRDAGAVMTARTYWAWETTATLRLLGVARSPWAPTVGEGGILCRHTHSLFAFELPYDPLGCLILIWYRSSFCLSVTFQSINPEQHTSRTEGSYKLQIWRKQAHSNRYPHFGADKSKVTRAHRLDQSRVTRGASCVMVASTSTDLVMLFVFITENFLWRNTQLNGSVKEPNKFHVYETEKITRKASDAAEHIELFSSFTRYRHARRF